jgi:hypothetical protein
MSHWFRPAADHGKVGRWQHATGSGSTRWAAAARDGQRQHAMADGGGSKRSAAARWAGGALRLRGENFGHIGHGGIVSQKSRISE